MRVDQITIQARSLALGNLGEVDKGYINDLKIVKRFNNVGSWTFSLPAEYDMAATLSVPGRGIKITGPGWVVSGPMISVSHKQEAQDVEGTLFFVGADDMVHLADGAAFPDPAEEDPGAQTLAHDVRTGNAETVMRAYLNANRGPGAPSSRRINAIALQTNLNRGDTITARARFDNLGQLISECALQGGGLGFDMVQNNTSIEFKVYVPQDKSATVRMDIANDMLTKTEYGYGSPTATRAIVAGQGEMVDRKFVQVTSTDSLAAETQWGRKIEYFKDRRDTNDDTELTLEGEAIVGVNGVTVKSLSVTPADDIANQEFGIDWFLGDKVGVVVDGQPISAVVTEAVIIMDTEGVRVGATLGDPVGFDYDAKLVQKQQDQEKRLALVEKNSASSATVDGLSSDLAAFILEVANKRYWRNLIRNARFRINQRAWASGGSLALNQYFFDGWRSTYNGSTSAWTFTGSEQAGRVLTASTSSRSVAQIIEQADIIPGNYVAGSMGPNACQVRVYNVGATPPAYSSGPIVVALDGTANVVVEYNRAGGTTSTLDRPFLIRAEAWSGYFPDISIEDDLRWCRRYYYRITVATADYLVGLCQTYSSGVSYCVLFLPVQMRATPTASWSGLTTSLRAHAHGQFIANCTAVSFPHVGTERVEIQVSHSGAAVPNGGAALLQGSGSSTGYFEFVAEL